MLNPQSVESKNLLTINGTLSEIDVQDGKTSDGREYVRGRAIIRVDQEINGEVVENDIPVQMFSMRKKKDGTPNPNYDRILKYKTQLVPKPRQLSEPRTLLALTQEISTIPAHV